MNIRTIALAFLLAAAPAFAADVDGKWKGTVDTPGGPVEVNYTFKADGEKLTGAALSPDGTPVAIDKGKITGSKLSFSLTLDFGGGPTTFDYTGVVSPTELKLHTEFMGMPIDFTLKKA